MKLPVLLFLPLLCAGADLPADITALVDSARGVPPEFTADALIRIAAVNRVEKPRKIELLEEAFRSASGAHDRMKLRPFQTKFSGPAGFLEKAAKQDLDTLSLQLRTVEAMLPLDPVKARDLFASIAEPELPRLDCKTSMVPDVSRYYEVLGRLADETYSPKQIAAEEPFKLLMRYLTVNSAAQAGPAASTLAKVKLRSAQFRALLGQYMAGLKAVEGDDRTFTFWRGAGVNIGELAGAAAKYNISPVPLLEAYRAYLVRHLSGARCADNTQLGVKVVLESFAGQLEKAEAPLSPSGYFNDTLRSGLVPAITRDEETPRKSEGEAEGLKECTSVECVEIGKQYRMLVLKSNSIPYIPAEKAEAEWQNRLREYLTALTNWQQDTGTGDAEHFRTKSGVYTELLAVVPSGANRDAVLRSTLQYLEQTRSSVARPAEWFLPVNLLIARVALDPQSLSAFGADLRTSRDAVIALYANLERLAPRTPDRIMPLL
jgi:hypothetical protein